jgi:hypothetical protein
MNTAKTNDAKNVIYKNLTTTVEYINSASVELNSTVKSATVTKTIKIKNSGEDDVYVDFVWKNVDTDLTGINIIYTISGSSVKGFSNPSTEENVIPTTTTNGLLMGELIKANDEVDYTIVFKDTNKTITNYLIGNIGVNIRN